MGRHPYMTPSSSHITPTPTGKQWIPTSNVTPTTVTSTATPTPRLAERGPVKINVTVVHTVGYCCVLPPCSREYVTLWQVLLLTTCSSVCLEKLTSLQPVKKFPHFTETECSLPHSQVPSTCPYPEPAQSSPCTHISLHEDRA